jgi:hypothetical protein
MVPEFWMEQGFKEENNPFDRKQNVENMFQFL